MRAILLILALAGNSWAVKITQTTSGSGSGGTTDSTKVRLTGDVMSGPLTTTSATVTGMLQASSGVFTGGWGVSNTYGAVLVSSGVMVVVSTSNNAGTEIFSIRNATGTRVVSFMNGNAAQTGVIMRTYTGATDAASSFSLDQIGNGVFNGLTAGSALKVTGSSVFIASMSITNGAFTVAAGSVSVPNSGIYAASGTFINGVTASSGSFTQTSTYSIVSSSGLFVRAGTIDLSMKPDIGIRYYDGSVSTTAALPTAAASVAASSVAVTFIGGSPTFTNTSFGGCLSNTLAGGTTVEIAVAAGDKGVKIVYGMTFYTDSLSGYVAVNVIRDQVNFQAPSDSNSGWSTKIQAVVNDVTSQNASVFFPNLSVGNHTFCLAGAVTAGTGVLNCGAAANGLDSTACYIYGEAVK